MRDAAATAATARNGPGARPSSNATAPGTVQTFVYGLRRRHVQLRPSTGACIAAARNRFGSSPSGPLIGVMPA